jgi:hypothetical protein
VSDLHQCGPTAAPIERGKRGARRTAWMFAGIAVAVYVGFMLIVALGK